MKRVGDRLLRLVKNPPAGLRWTCPRCEMAYVNSVPPPGGICDECMRRRVRVVGRDVILSAAGVPDRLRVPFVEPGPAGMQSAWPVDAADRPCTDWQRLGWCLLLWGDNGTGKSMLAAELLARAVLAKPPLGAVWIRASRIASATLSGAAESIAYAVEAPLLAVDELGRGHDAAAAWSVVVDALCQRWERNLPTIVTTNRSPRELAAPPLVEHCAPLLDRLRDGMVCAMKGQSLRGCG